MNLCSHLLRMLCCQLRGIVKHYDMFIFFVTRIQIYFFTNVDALLCRRPRHGEVSDFEVCGEDCAACGVHGG